MTSDPESQKRHQAWLDKTTHLPPDPYSTDAVERRAADNLGLFNRPISPPDPGATRGLAILVLIGGGAALFAAIVVVAYVYDFVRAHPLVTVTGLVAAVGFYYLPRRWKIRSAVCVIGLCLAALAAVFVTHSVQENALVKVNARETDFIAAAEPKFRAIAFHAVERGLRRAGLCGDCKGEARTDFRPAGRPGALLIITRTVSYSWPLSGHRMNIYLKASATISQDDIKNNIPIEPRKIRYSQPELIAEFVFPDKRSTYGGAVRLRSLKDLSSGENSFVNTEIVARNAIAQQKIRECQSGNPFKTREGNETVSMLEGSETVEEKNSEGLVQRTNYFKCESMQTNSWPDVVNTLRFTLRSYSLMPGS